MKRIWPCIVALSLCTFAALSSVRAQAVIDPSIVAHVIQPDASQSVPNVKKGEIVACDNTRGLRSIVEFYYHRGAEAAVKFISWHAGCALFNRPFLTVGVPTYVIPDANPMEVEDRSSGTTVSVWIIAVYFLDVERGLADTTRRYYVASLAELFR
ncbi:MAG: hypothetical protein G01um1014106_574 [Parcubacteria group bacterium Gr01-1014_106]|nr:MAG: hypothetical protein G01um1014106_574 [Parcubacteria group bacterium Gr01-1014_106]